MLLLLLSQTVGNRVHAIIESLCVFFAHPPHLFDDRISEHNRSSYTRAFVHISIHLKTALVNGPQRRMGDSEPARAMLSANSFADLGVVALRMTGYTNGFDPQLE
jgi:hypothetical protein